MKSKTQRKGHKLIISYPRRNRFIKPFANNTDAFNPERWAAESVYILNEEMKYGAMVHRDFEDEIAQFGETVHTRKVGGFSGKFKQNDLDDVEDQDVTATNIDVQLNQRVYVSFILGDGARSMSFKNLVDEYLREAIIAQTRRIDQVVGAQAYRFLGNASGGLGTMTAANVHDRMLDMREVFNNLKVPEQNRWLALASRSETLAQKADIFKSAERIGDGGRALREASLGRLAGWNTVLELNTPSVRAVTNGTATTTTAAVLAGATTAAVTSVASIASGQYVVFAGEDSPQRVNSIASLTLTLNRAFRNGCANGAAVTPVASGLINQASPIAAGDKTAAVADGYPQYWRKPIVVDGTGVPRVGQLVAFKAAGGTVHAPEYGIIDVSDLGGGNYEITLDRPLENTLANNDVVDYGPAGDYNFAFQRNAVALVNRPLADIDPMTGVRSARGFANKVSLRVTFSYDGKKQGTRVVVDGLFGVAVLDTQLGGVLLA